MIRAVYRNRIRITDFRFKCCDKRFDPKISHSNSVAKRQPESCLFHKFFYYKKSMTPVRLECLENILFEFITLSTIHRVQLHFPVRAYIHHDHLDNHSIADIHPSPIHYNNYSILHCYYAYWLVLKKLLIKWVAS